MNKLKNALLTGMMVLGLVALPLAPADAGAINVIKKNCKGGNGNTTICRNSGDKVQPLIQKIIRILLVVLGGIAVVMIIVGGIKYTASNGDSAQIKSAKDTILYSIVGLVIALLSYAIVEFVISYF